MKMLHALDSAQSQILTLKIFVLILVATSILLSVAVILSTQKPPLLIERGCTTQVSRVGNEIPTDSEVKGFIELALHSRFDSKALDLSYLAPEQQGFRAIEQKDLESQKMRQSLIVNDISIKDGAVLADCDRLIAVGNIRSTFRFPLKIEFQVVPRSSGNPYGLLLKRAEPLITEVKK